MRVANLLTAAILTALVAGCAGTPAPTTAVVTVEKPALMLPNVDKIRLNDVDWNIVTRNAKPGTDGHIDTVWKKVSGDSLFAVNSRDYEDLSLNTAQMMKIIIQLQAQVKAYKEYYQKEPEKIKEEDNGKKTAP
jgi:hypothetical protein